MIGFDKKTEENTRELSGKTRGGDVENKHHGDLRGSLDGNKLETFGFDTAEKQKLTWTLGGEENGH